MLSTLQMVDSITQYDELFKILIQRNPSIESDLASFKLNPGCECKSNIQLYLDNNKAEREFIDDWLKSKPEQIFNKSSDEINRLKSEVYRMSLKPSLPQSEWKNFKDVIGETVEIDPNPDKYKELMAIAREKWFYNGLTVLETLKTNHEDGSDKIIWVVFFY